MKYHFYIANQYLEFPIKLLSYTPKTWHQRTEGAGLINMHSTKYLPILDYGYGYREGKGYVRGDNR